MALDFRITGVSLADAVLDDAVADLVAIGHLDHMVAEGAHQLARLGLSQRPHIVL
jgi:hypothetical protein